MRTPLITAAILCAFLSGCATHPPVGDLALVDTLTDYVTGPPPEAANAVALSDQEARFVSGWSSQQKEERNDLQGTYRENP